MILYILGNGYDLYKGLPTRYSDFAYWVKKNHFKDYENITRLFKLDGLWSDFENKAANSYNIISQEIDDEIESYEYNSDGYGEEWRDDSDKSYVVHNYVADKMIDGITLPRLMREWIEWVLKTKKPKKVRTNKQIINFNYTDYIYGVNNNVCHIHESISYGGTLQFGHSKERMLENIWTKLKVSDYGNDYPDAKYIFNQLSKHPRVSKDRLKKHLIINKPTKLIFFGFSFGEQDLQYFDLFDSNIDVDFYFKDDGKTQELFQRVKNQFPKANFKNIDEWDDDF
ncbi:AbiH family protein [Mycoplasma todarodis]|uniref:AbiH family protein n=1 Tax=Mycoplasma todarodis TaxID=1937191 RepID=UPI003B2E5338